MVSRVCTVWPMSRPKSLSSRSLLICNLGEFVVDY